MYRYSFIIFFIPFILNSHLSINAQIVDLQVSARTFSITPKVGTPSGHSRTGHKIEAALPYVLTCGYTNGRCGFIPDASGVDDREYMSGHLRYGAINKSYTKIVDNIGQKGMKFFTPPYKAPGGDACAEVAVIRLGEFAR
jgi:hypothetical protein